MVLLLWISSSWIFSIWKAGAITWEHCATYYLCCTLWTFLLCARCLARKLLLRWFEIFCALHDWPSSPDLHFPAPAPVFSSHTHGNRTYWPTSDVRDSWSLCSGLRASYSNLFHQPVLSPCTLISFPAILLLDTLTSSAPVWLAAPHLLDTLTSFTPFEQCKGETTSDCLTDFATLSEQTGPVCECC